MVSYNALSFDGVDDYVEVSHSSTLSLTTSGGFTISAIFRVYEVGDWGYIITKRAGSGGIPGYSLIVDPSGYIYGVIDDGTGAQITTSATTVTPGRWYHVVYVVDGATQKLFVNGVLESTTNYDISDITNTEPLKIGTRGDLKNYLNGAIAQILIYKDVVFSDTEVQNLYNDPLNPPADGLVLWYYPDSVDTTNGIWTDKSGNGNDGTIYGATCVPLRPVSESTPSTNRPYGLYFDGEDDYVVVQDNSLDLTDFAIVAMFEISGSGNGDWPGIASKYTYGDGGYALYWDILNGMVRGVSRDPSVGSSIVSYPIQLNRTHFVAVTRDDTVMKMFVNGELVGSVDNPIAPAINDLPLYIGRQASNYLNGKVYFAMVYSRALSDEEIQQIYENPTNPPTDGLVLWLSPESLDTTNGKWLNRAEILNTGLVEQLDGTEYGTLEIPIRYTTVSDLEEIWELNTLRLNWPWPTDIQNRVTINQTIVNTLGGGRVAYVFGTGGDGVDLIFYVKQDELDDVRAEAKLGSWTVRTPSDWLEYYGDYVVQDVSVKPKVPGVFEATIRLEKIG